MKIKVRQRWIAGQDFYDISHEDFYGSAYTHTEALAFIKTITLWRKPTQIRTKGTLLEFYEDGVAKVDVPDRVSYVYFTPKNIEGYRQETVKELKKMGWNRGCVVILFGHDTLRGDLIVDSVRLA